jgi:phosphate transport system permease protein
MNVSLTPELKQFVRAEVEAGMYQTASEVVRAGLRRLKEDQESRASRTPKTLAAFALGLVLFFVTLMLNIIALYVVRKYREQYE